jgi:Uma2 family endonuclease
MHIQLDLPSLPTRLILESPLSDEEFEYLAMTNDFMQLERSKHGEIILNAPAGGYTGNGNSEIIFQLQAWWKTHKQGRVFDSNTGFFLSDTSSYSPDAAYVTAEQLSGFTQKQLEHFPRLCPAFVIELVSRTDRRKTVEAKMLSWMANGAQVAWLIDPYKKSITIFEAGKSPRTTRAKIVHGTGPIAGFEFNTTDVWSCYEL